MQITCLIEIVVLVVCFKNWTGCWRTPEWMSLSRNKLIHQAQIVADRNYLISFPGLFQQAGTFVKTG